MPVYYDKNGWPYSDELYHHGIKGQRWGVRRFVNADGTLTPEGKARYGSIENYYKQKEDARKAKLDASVSRGKRLLDNNRTRIGTIGRTIAKDFAISAVVGLGGGAVSMLLANGVMNGKISDASAKRIATGARAAASVLTLGMTAANWYSAGRDIVDITRAKDAGHVRKKDR